nr:RNA-directed DNA polymerase, eukaryota [Tanacetum cinerariifolium]
MKPRVKLFIREAKISILAYLFNVLFGHQGIPWEIVSTCERWNGEVLLMGDFNEVRLEEERYGSIFNFRGAAAFNSFIVDSGLVEVPSGGFSFTWSHRSATKISILDRFLVFEDLQRSCLNLSSLTLNRYLSDHMPILLRELNILKGHIRVWVKDKRASASNLKKDLKNKLSNIDFLIDKGKVSSAILEDRLDTMNKLASLENMESSELAQKAKVKWSIEGDENSKFFHGIINKRQNNLAIRGIMVDGDWMEDPAADLMVSRLSKDEIKGAVWDGGLDKSAGPDGFTFGFYRRYWSLLEDEVVEAVNHFYNNGFCHKGGISSFIALIPKTQGAKLVKDFRPVSLIGSLYKIITKLLANRLVTVIGNIVNDVQSAFIANRQILDGPFILDELIHCCKAKKKETMIFKVNFEKAFDSVRWDFFEDVLKNFGFGSRWWDWIISCLKYSKGSVLVNGSPTSEFQFYKGLKHDDPLSPFLFILVMETLYLSFKNVVNAGLFKGVVLNNSLQLSHLFYADDAIFVGPRCTSNITAIIRILKCFFVLLAYALTFKKVINKLEDIHSHFIHGVDTSVRKMMHVKWSDILASKEMRDLGVSSFYALNRALIVKWVWRSRTQGNSIWTKVIKALHGEEGNLDWPTTAKFPSNWLDIIRFFSNLYKKETESFLSLRLETILMIKFWERLALKLNGVSLSRLRSSLAMLEFSNSTAKFIIAS